MEDTLGQVLMRIRETLGLSRTDVEQLTAGEFAVETLRLYEKDRRNISVNRLMRLCEFYGVDIGDVLSPNTMERISLKGLGAEDKEFVKNTVAWLRRREKEDDFWIRGTRDRKGRKTKGDKGKTGDKK